MQIKAELLLRQFYAQIVQTCSSHGAHPQDTAKWQTCRLCHFTCLKPLKWPTEVILLYAFPMARSEKLSCCGIVFCRISVLHQVVSSILHFLLALHQHGHNTFHTVLQNYSIIFSINISFLSLKELTSLIKSYFKNRLKSNQHNNLVLGLTQTFQNQQFLLESENRKETHMSYNM